MKKKYNSIYTLSCAVDHEQEDGSDVTPMMLLAAITKRLSGLCASGDIEILESFGCPDDTTEN